MFTEYLRVDQFVHTLEAKRGTLQAGTLGSMPSSEQQLSSLVEDFFFNPDVSHQECVQQAKGLSKRELHQVACRSNTGRDPDY